MDPIETNTDTNTDTNTPPPIKVKYFTNANTLTDDTDNLLTLVLQHQWVHDAINTTTTTTTTTTNTTTTIFRSYFVSIVCRCI